MSLAKDHTDYWASGFQSSQPALSFPEVTVFRTRLEVAEAAEREARGGTWEDRDFYPWKNEPHPLSDWFVELAGHPGVLKVVCEVLGPDVLVRNADVFIKEPGVRRDIGWHTDTSMRTEDMDGYLTAWIGLTPSTTANGGMQFAVGSHLAALPDAPVDKFHLTLERRALDAVRKMSHVDNVMPAGHLSMHHALTAHRSSYNQTGERRIAYVVRYMKPTVTAASAESGAATLVCGEDKVGNFSLKSSFPVTWRPQIP
jgi:ectoine hydroxylase-related dioxygenase (phytanoyl-CoA dioxygenase family)